MKLSQIKLSFYQPKYAICWIRKVVAASGAMGLRVKEDSVHNVFVNTQGKF